MSLIINGTEVQEVVYNGNSLNKVICDGVTVFEKTTPAQAYLTFSEENNSNFTLKVYDTTKHWGGTLYYSTDTENWTEWNGEEISSTADGKLYVRGAGNTKIAGNKKNYRWVLTADKRIQCTGNIESLLDYETVEQGSHPQMAGSCYYNIFYGCTSLTVAPELPATTLTNYCYQYMFYGCTSLTSAPELPATSLTYYCYDSMFLGCTSLTVAPELPATTLANKCYYYMFKNCTALTGQIHLPASVSGNSYRLTDTDISGSSATIVFDL